MTATDTTLSISHPADPEQILPTDREDWLKMRTLGLGGSDAAAVCGLNPYRGPYSVWAEKTGRHTDVVDSEAVKWGALLEPVILNEWADQSGMHPQTEPHMLRSREYPWMQANLDAIVDDTIIVEIKTAGARMVDSWTEEPPIYYWVQGLHYAAVTGRHTCIFVCLLAGQQLVVHEVHYTPASLDHLVRVERDFWRHVEQDEPPAAELADVPTLAELRPDPGDTVTVDEELALELAHSYHVAAEAERRARQLKDESADRLKLLIGEHETAVTPSGFAVASWKTIERKGFTVAPSSHRKLTVPKPKNGRDHDAE